MNLRKHVAGFALFSIILGSAVLINGYVNSPLARIPPVPVTAPSLPPVIEARQTVNYEVRLVSLDLMNDKTYTTLLLRRQSGQSAPESLWVMTAFFAPDYAPDIVWSNVAEIRRPFAAGDVTEISVTSSCVWCAAPNPPRAGYFARVYVSTENPGYAPYPSVPFDRDITTAIPVVVQAERKLHR